MTVGQRMEVRRENNVSTPPRIQEDRKLMAEREIMNSKATKKGQINNAETIAKLEGAPNANLIMGKSIQV